MAAVNGFRAGSRTFAPAFRQGVRQASCHVDPYRPRAALLETASFFLDDSLAWRNRQRLHQQVMTAENLSDSERDEAFRAWRFPGHWPACCRTMASVAIWPGKRAACPVCARSLPGNG